MVHTKGLATDSRAEFTFFIQTPVKGVKTLKKCLLLSKIPHFKQETNPKPNSGVRFRIFLAERVGFPRSLAYFNRAPENLNERSEARFLGKRSNRPKGETDK